MSKEQWVNLPETDDFVADSIKSKERLGSARFRVKFKKASLAGFRVKVIPLGGKDHERYSKDERNRNPNFRVRVAGSASNKGKTEVVLDKKVLLNAAGGNQYKIQAQYKKKVVESGLVLEARRKLLYQAMSMRGVTAPSTDSLEKAFWQPAKNYYIEVKKHGGTATIEHIPCIDGTPVNRTRFVRAAAKAYTLAKFKPYAFAVAFVGYIAKPADETVQREIDFTMPSKISAWNVADEVWTFELDKYLWYELDPDDDRRHRWFRSCTLWFEPENSPGARERLPISVDDIRPTGAKRGPYGGRKKVEVRVPLNEAKRNLFTSRKGKWKLELKLVCVKGFSAGRSLGGINLVAIATKGWWRDSASNAEYVMNHEVGHKVGMVADGTGRAPGKHANLYGDQRGVNDRDHKGPHCSKGASWDGTKKRGQRWSGAPECVMFGATGIGRNRAPGEFCDDCAALVRKLDLSGSTLALKGFRKSLDEI